MKIKLFIILALTLFMFSCVDDGSNADGDATGDATGDTVAVVEDDSTGDTGTVIITIVQDDPIDIGETDETPIDSDIDPTEDTEPDTPGVIVVEVPKNELLTHIDISGVRALALRPRIDSISNYVSGRMMSIIGGGDCQEMGSLNGDTYNEIATEGSVPCFSNVEMSGEFIFANYYLDDVTESPALMYLSQTPVDFSIIIDASGDVHHLPGQPKKRNSFKNIKMIHSHNGKPTYINKDNKLVWFNLSTDTEIVMVDEAITNFSIKPKSDGDHYIVDSTAGIKRIKPDKSEDMLPELTPGNWHDIGGSIQYVTGGYFKRIIFDDDGNITDRVAYSNPETMWLFINDYTAFQALGLGNGLPRGINFSGSISGCDNEIVNGQRVMICNGKAFRVKGDGEDLEEINWIGYGHPNFNSWLTIRSCASQAYLYFYSESDSMGNRLTWINNSTSEFRDILDTHQIKDLECISDSELAVIGTIGELTETLSITEADTMSPVVTVIDSQITDVITP